MQAQEKLDILAFNRKMWPRRKNELKTIIEWRIFKNPFLSYFEEDLIAKIDGVVVGQIIPIYGNFISGLEQYNCVWGSDYIVDQVERGSTAGVKVLKAMIKNYLHFGVGMSDVSLKMHKVMREKEIAQRFDFLFIAGKKQKVEVQYVDLTYFLENFESKFLGANVKETNVNYFERSASFYSWIFAQAKKENIKIAFDQKRDGYVLFYDTKYKGVPIVKIIDYSVNYLNDKEALLSVINDYGYKSFKKIFFFSGTTDFSEKVTHFRKRVFPIYSNIKRMKITYQDENRLHVTGLDSDRFINSFL